MSASRATDRRFALGGESVSARVLVAYASKLGSTAEIAETIAHVLRDGGHYAEAVPARDVASLERYDAVVLGSALYSAYWQRDAHRFVDRFREQLKARPLWLFSGGPLDRRLAKADQPITPHGAEITKGLGARAHHTFGGRLAPDADVAPQILQTHRFGDFRDWQKIVEYGYRIGRELDRMSFPANGDR
jgi:menaquinone-dependent protoporphyrinogen oxidase